jgi:hypothetical protein
LVLIPKAQIYEADLTTVELLTKMHNTLKLKAFFCTRLSLGRIAVLKLLSSFVNQYNHFLVFPVLWFHQRGLHQKYYKPIAAAD